MTICAITTFHSNCVVQLSELNETKSSSRTSCRTLSGRPGLRRPQRQTIEDGRRIASATAPHRPNLARARRRSSGSSNSKKGGGRFSKRQVPRRQRRLHVLAGLGSGADLLADPCGGSQIRRRHVCVGLGTGARVRLHIDPRLGAGARRADAGGRAARPFPRCGKEVHIQLDVRKSNQHVEYLQ